MRKMRALLKPIWLSWPAEFTLGPGASADPGAGHPGDEGLREWQCALTVIYRLLTRSPHSHLPAKHSTINPQSHLPQRGRGIAYEKSNTGGQKFDSVVAPSGFAGFENCRSKPVPIRKFLGQLRPSIRNPICDSPALVRVGEPLARQRKGEPGGGSARNVAQHLTG